MSLSGDGLSCHRSQKRQSAKNGTNQPKLYCSFTDHSPLSSLQSPNQRAARNKTLSANASGNLSRDSGAVSVNLCGVATFSTGRELTKFVPKANRECFRMVKRRAFDSAAPAHSAHFSNGTLRDWRLTQTPYNHVSAIPVYVLRPASSRHSILQRRCR